MSQPPPLRVHALTAEPDDSQLALPGVRHLWDLWHAALSRRGTLPAWSDLGQQRLARCLDNLMLLEVLDEGRDFRYAIYGTGIARHFGRDMTGLRTSELPGPAANLFSDIYMRILGERRPYFSRTEAAASVTVDHWDRLMMPLADDGENVDHIVAVNYPRAWRAPPELFLQLCYSLNHLEQGLCVFDDEQRLMVWNAPFRELMAVPEAACRRGMRLRELAAHVGTLEREGHAPPSVSGEQALISLGFEDRRRDGTVVDIRCRRLPDGGLVTTFSDVTESHRAAARLGEANRELEVRVNARTEDLSEAIKVLREEVVERKRVEGELAEQKERAEVTLRSIGDAVITTDADGNVKFMNPAAERLTQWSEFAARGKPVEWVFRVVDGGTREPLPGPLERTANAGKVTYLPRHTVLIGHEGTERAVQESVAAIRGPGGELLGVVLVVSDVTEARELEQRMAHQAAHDMLTGLVNRHEFEARLRRALERTESEAAEHVVCYMDLDQFKLVNDTAGHVAGDELLREISAQLKRRVRRGDTLARLGGDEFGVLMEDCAVDDVMSVIEDLRKLIEDYRLSWDGKVFSAGVSIGVAPVSARLATVTSVMSAADSACYAAKDAGRNRVHVYREDDSLLTRQRGQMHLATRLQQAVEQGRFELHYQPIVPLGDSERRLHYELLVRMQDGEGGVVAAHEFLPAAERYQVSSHIDHFVVRSALEWLAGSPQVAASTAMCSINLSGLTLNDETFSDFVRKELERTGIDPSTLCFEVTETAAIYNLGRAVGLIQTLRGTGVRFALDDFGSGLSSFAYLKALPVDLIKIDGAFVKDVARDPVDLATVRAIQDVARATGMATVAEGVEDRETLEELSRIGLDYAQGYYLGYPEPVQLLRTGRESQAAG